LSQVLKWTTSPFAADAADDDSAKKLEADDAKQHAGLVGSVLVAKWNVEKTALVQVGSYL
jgi:hypothetical protein